MNATIQGITKEIIEECIKYLVISSTDRVDRSDVIRMVAEIVECSGGTIDACSHCGRMPMEPICNNARCQDQL